MRNTADVTNLRSWHDNWSGLRVAVLGLGMTGFAAADTLAELGAKCLVLADSADSRTAEVLEVIGVPVVLTGQVPSAVAKLEAFAPELVVVSPGFRPTHPLVVWASEHGVPVWGDIELAWRLRDKVGTAAEWIAVTGTNGKTTTVQLVAAMLAADGRRVIACGNVGVPVLDAIRDPSGFEILVVELSSFQLHYADSISAHSSVCLNLADDHLDWHGSADAYRAAKAKVYQATRVACVFNQQDSATRAMVEEADVVDGCRAIGFTLGVPGLSDLGVVDGILVDRAFLGDRHHSALELVTSAELGGVGLGSPHMTANVLAASALARSVGVAPETIRRALRAFRLDQHRTELVATSGDVRWFNDSKATNPHAAAAALVSFESIVWIVGGLFKGVDVDELVSAQVSRLRAAVVIGNDRQPLLEAFARHAPELPVFEVISTDTNEVMPTAVRLSAAAAQGGDVVLLAPAAASMDQFTNYADRGNRFTAAVHELLGDLPDDNQPSALPPTPGA
ncbi:MAG: UDP-N-acetylmuramoyl-L-alanine--D-glutamate ligase [Lacisediminihabitans sp.]